MRAPREPAGPERRRAALRRGRRGETAAAWWLRLKGYRILARGLRSHLGEIDILAARGRTLAAVEVKTRPHAETAAAALRPRQQARIVRALELYIAGRPDLAGRELRFDVVLVAPYRWPRHLADAWRPAAGPA